MSVEHPVRVRIRRIHGETPKGLLGKDLHFPALIGNIGWEEQARHTDYDTVSAGEFSQPAMGPARARQLRRLDDLDTLTMKWSPEWLHDADRPPHEVRALLVRILRSRKPVQLLMRQKGLKDEPAILMCDVTMRAFKPLMKGNEPDTMYFTLSWAEWRNASTARKGAGKPAEIPSTVKLKADDTLYSLAMKWFHTATAAAD